MMPVRFAFQPLPLYTCLPFFLIACGGNATSPETNPNMTTSSILSDNIELSGDSNTSAQDTTDTDLLEASLRTCAERINTSPEKLLEEITRLTGKSTPGITTEALGTEGLHTIWSSDADVICVDAPAADGGINLIQTLSPNQVLYGSGATDYVALQSGGVFFGGDGDDFVATLTGGLFYGEEGNDQIDSPVTARIYDGWQFAAIESQGATGGQFIGGPGNDHIGALNGAEFLGQDDADSVTTLLSGKFFGGDGRDSVSDPTLVRLGNMSGGQFYGEDGDDWVDIASGGDILGGAGDDIVQSISNGSFEGMNGDDTVYSLVEKGRFSGGNGNDAVDSMNRGTYDGGAGRDTLQVYTDGEVTNVESVPTCLQSTVASRSSRCLAGAS